MLWIAEFGNGFGLYTSASFSFCKPQKTSVTDVQLAIDEKQISGCQR
jgi:hypothetical protein